MGFFDGFPFTNTHQLNLDWILQRIGKVDADSRAAVEAAAKASESAAKAVEAAATFDTDKTLSVAGKAADAAATGAAIKKARPVNLLDNSDFRNPVNQRGRMDNTESGYTIDRWELNEAGEANVQVQSPENGFDENRILFIVSSGRADLIQRLENYAQQEGKTHTLAINVEGVAHIVTFAMGQQAGGLAIGDTGLTFYSTPSDHVLLRLDTAKIVSLYWAALYEGEYTAEALPEYQPKGYGAELAECMRYYYQNYYGEMPQAGFASLYAPLSGKTISVMFPTPMRVTPTITLYNPTTGHSGCVADWATDADVIANAIYSNEHNFIVGGDMAEGQMIAYNYEASADL